MKSNGRSSEKSTTAQKKTTGKDLKLYSLERRRDRYRIIYIWKVLEGHVPNVNSKISSKTHVRLGRMCEIPNVKNGKLAKIINASFPVHGQRLFNTLPKCLLTGVELDSFKRALGLPG